MLGPVSLKLARRLEEEEDPIDEDQHLRPKDADENGASEKKSKVLKSMGRLPTQQTVEIHENLERKRLKVASIKKAAGKEMKQTGIITKISKQRLHKFIPAKNISKSVTRASRCTATTNQNKN